MSTPVSAHDEIMAAVEELIARGQTPPRAALDEVNVPMIRHWAEAIGDTDPRWQPGPDTLAPPAMAQVWTMYGLDPHRPAGDPLHGTMQLLDRHGYTSVLGTNSDQTYARFLRPGERVSVTARLESVVGPKQTGVGEGYFVTTASTWWVGDEAVATMKFRVLKFKPGATRPDPTKTVRPVVNRDNQFFFDGARHGEVRIQSCAACGALRHPPGPVCPECHAMERDYVVASGKGRVHSFTIHHAPQVPGKALPLPLVLVDLDEGVRMVGAYRGPEPEVGQVVEVVFDRIDDDLTLVAWAPEGAAVRAEAAPEPAADTLEPWVLPITPTLVISAAIATRDFQDVHHDRDLAVQRGTNDIFLNILTTTGLVHKYVGDRFGQVRITSCALRLGAPAYPYDTLTITGRVISESGAETVVDVVGRVSLGDHVTARITFVAEEGR